MPASRVQTPVMMPGFEIEAPGQPAPGWTTREWFNTETPLQLSDLLGRVVVLHAFQMLCPAILFVNDT